MGLWGPRLLPTVDFGFVCWLFDGFCCCDLRLFPVTSNTVCLIHGMLVFGIFGSIFGIFGSIFGIFGMFGIFGSIFGMFGMFGFNG